MLRYLFQIINIIIIIISQAKQQGTVWHVTVNLGYYTLHLVQRLNGWIKGDLHVVLFVWEYDSY